MSPNFITTNRNQQYLFPPSVQDWLPEDHLARFVVDIVSQLDIKPLSEAYGGRGSKAYHPEILLSLLFYGYATGVYSSRKIEQATYECALSLLDGVDITFPLPTFIVLDIFLIRRRLPAT